MTQGERAYELNASGPLTSAAALPAAMTTASHLGRKEEDDKGASTQVILSRKRYGPKEPGSGILRLADAKGAILM